VNIRLTWKIFFAFWGALWLATGLPMLFIILFGQNFPNPDQLGEERYAAAQVLSHYAGRDAVDAATANWDASQRTKLFRQLDAAPGSTKTIDSPPVTIGAKYWGYAIHVFIGMGASLLLALYLARPLVWLRDGFRKIAKGHLGTRLTPHVGRRRDEIADLAHDFDLMAEQLQELILNRERILHELRSPLARLNVAIGLARKNGQFSDEVLVRIEAEGTRVNQLVENFLTLSRLESDAQVEEHYFDIADLLRVVTDDAEFEAQATRVSVALQISPELDDPTKAPVICGAPELVRRALDNIIRNAIRFSPAGTTVVVAADKVGSALRVEVTDEGPGATPTMLKNMFNPFVKGRGDSRGIGLGLAIAKRAVEAHNGSLIAANREQGGLRMTLTMPFRRQESASGAALPKTAERVLSPAPTL
jgi:two-component system OmpR family sensor kinase